MSTCNSGYDVNIWTNRPTQAESIRSNTFSKSAFELFNEIGFKSASESFRMYRGYHPPVSMNDVYGLACLELG